MRSSPLYDRNDYAGENNGAGLYVVVDKLPACLARGILEGILEIVGEAIHFRSSKEHQMMDTVFRNQ
jgi:hypothetical protein